MQTSSAAAPSCERCMRQRFWQCLAWSLCQKSSRKTALVIAPRSRRTRLHCSNVYTQTTNHPFKPSTPPRPCSQFALCSFRLQTRPCMLSRGVASHTKHPRPTAIAADAYRSVVCTYFCALSLWRVLATILETCSLAELLSAKAIRAVPPQLFSVSYKTCHKHGTRRRH